MMQECRPWYGLSLRWPRPVRGRYVLHISAEYISDGLQVCKSGLLVTHVGGLFFDGVLS